MGEVIKPEEVYAGDRIRITRAGKKPWVVEAVFNGSYNGWVSVQLDGLGYIPTFAGEDVTIELLDRPKTPAQVAFEAAQRYSKIGPHATPWGSDSINREYWDAIAQAVLDAAAKP